jgi:hypothetical protein
MFLKDFFTKQAAEKRPSAVFPSSFVIAAYVQRTPLADSPTRRRGEMSLLIRRDTTLRILGALHLGIFDQPVKE